MDTNNSAQQQKLIALFIFVPAVMTLAKGVSGLDDGINFLKIIMICGGLGGAVFAVYSFLKAPKN